MRLRPTGIYPPIPTIFDVTTGEVDSAAIEANVRRWMTTGLSGVLALGSNGETALLTDTEIDRVIEAARSAVPRDRLLLVGTGRESTRAAIVAATRAADLGADAVLVRAPFYYRGQMTTDVLTTHFRAVADASPVPVLLYNLPAITGFSFTVDLVARLAEHPNVVGLKETSTDLERLGQFAAIRPDTFAVLSGWAPVVYPALCAGAAGGILALANVLPEACVDIFEHTRAGRHEAARALQRKVMRLAQLVTSVHGIAGLKAAMDLAGYRGGPVRAPLPPASAAARDDIRRELAVHAVATSNG
jgi:4-hydroxy-2-oxoglutarate aldolase